MRSALLTTCCVQYLFHLNASEAYVDLDTIAQQIEETGAVVSSYIPDNTLLVIAQPEKLEALKQVAGVSLPIRLPNLTNQKAHTHSSCSTLVLTCYVEVYRGCMGG